MMRSSIFCVLWAPVLVLLGTVTFRLVRWCLSGHRFFVSAAALIVLCGFVQGRAKALREVSGRQKQAPEPWPIVEKDDWKDNLTVREVVVLGDSWMLRKAVGSQKSETAFSYVLAERLGVEIDPPFAAFGLTSLSLKRRLPLWRKDASVYGPNDLVLLHIGGNDIQPCIATCWFTSWSDEAQREHVRGYLRKVVENTINIIDSLCRRPFRMFVIAIPPFSRHVPLTNMVTRLSLQRLREETEQIYMEEFSAGKWKEKGCHVWLFHEPQHLDQMYDEQCLGNFVDLMHPGEEIHHELGLRLHQELTQQGVHACTA